MIRARSSTPSSRSRLLAWSARMVAVVALGAGVLSGCSDDDPPADTGGDGAGLETDEGGATETSVGGNEPGEGGADGMNDDPDSSETGDRTDASPEGGQDGTSGGDTG